MSRKKTLKSKGSGSASPSSALPPKENGQAGGARAKGGGSRPSPELPLNGVVLPSRPSLSSSGEFYDVAFKVMLVGDSGVGKTCLLVRFKDGAFLAGSFISTVGIDFREEKILDRPGQCQTPGNPTCCGGSEGPGLAECPCIIATVEPVRLLMAAPVQRGGGARRGRTAPLCSGLPPAGELGCVRTSRHSPADSQRPVLSVRGPDCVRLLQKT
ncbi:ras-related protein Rab-26 isoform X3 [Pelodiscus sinensis]|uniref:ras-related protein Rab-26 isoform X3 n=1 Tax=Pelodiscus sinensis TaxID=13735 RepID=UPI003F6B0AE6